MTSPKTVFVVGAGASYEFDLPVGNTLKGEIAETLSFSDNGFHISVGRGDVFIYEVLQTMVQRRMTSISFDQLIEASRRISSAMPLAPSIDNFIHVHNGVSSIEMCGKLAIAHRILRAEAASKLRLVSREQKRPKFESIEDTWIVALMKLLGEDCAIDQLADRLSNVAFIVFNYDRCIEHFFYHAIQLYYGISDIEAAQLVNQIAIYHPYGVVGKLPWQSNQNEHQSIEFGGSPTAFEIMRIANEIKTFTEGTDDTSSDIRAIRSAMTEADRMVFLGFAYHRLNIELLLGKTSGVRTTTRRAFGTAWGMSASDTDSVQNSLTHRLFAPSAVVRNDLKCAGIFHEFSRALAFV